MRKVMITKDEHDIVRVNGDRVTFTPSLLTEAIDNELVRQFEKWGVQGHDPFTWMTVTLEEFGEVAQALLKATFDKEDPQWYHVREEIVHTIACLVQLYTSVEGN